MTRRAPLVKNARSVGVEDKPVRRLTLWAMKRQSAVILRDEAVPGAARIAACGYGAHGDHVTQHVQTVAGETRSWFGGLQTCRNVWACPVCSARISEARRDELNRLLAGAREQGLVPLLLTLTFRHDRSMALADSLGAMKRALKRFRQSSAWRAFGDQGTVTATEVTHGDAFSWHPHQHLLVLASGSDPEEAVRRLSALASEWLACLLREGLSGNHAAFQVQSAAAAGAYVGKFGLAEELALSGKKAGRAGSRTPWQILRDATEGDPRSAKLWAEYAAAFRNRRQLVWSRGLKARFGIGEVADEDVPDQPGEPDPSEGEPSEPPRMVRVWLAAGTWQQARRRRCALLDAAEAGGCLDAAECGPTDAARWRSHQAATAVIDAECVA